MTRSHTINDNILHHIIFLCEINYFLACQNYAVDKYDWISITGRGGVVRPGLIRVCGVTGE